MVVDWRDNPEDKAYQDGLARGAAIGRDEFKRAVLRLLRIRHVNAVKFAAEGDMAGAPSVYFEARADLLAVLVKEVGEL